MKKLNCSFPKKFPNFKPWEIQISKIHSYRFAVGDYLFYSCHSSVLAQAEKSPPSNLADAFQATPGKPPVKSMKLNQLWWAEKNGVTAHPR